MYKRQGVLCSLIMYLTASLAMSFMLGTGQGTAFSEGTGYLKVISCFYVLCFIGNGLVGYFEGNGRVTVPIIGATMHITLRVILSWLFVRSAGLNAVALATGIGWLLAVSLWWVVYLVSPGPARR